MNAGLARDAEVGPRRLVVSGRAPWRRLLGLVLVSLGAVALSAGDFERLPARLVFGVGAVVLGLLLATALERTVIDGETRSLSRRFWLLFVPLSAVDLRSGQASRVTVDFAPSKDGGPVPSRVVGLDRSLGAPLVLRRTRNAAAALQLARRVAEMLGVPVSDHTGARRRFRGDLEPLPSDADAGPAPFEARLGRVSCTRRDGERVIEVDAGHTLDVPMLWKLLGTFVPAGVALAFLAERHGVDDLTVYAVGVGFALIFLPIGVFIIWSWLRMRTRWTLSASAATLVLQRRRVGTRAFRIPLDGLVIEEALDPAMTRKGALPCLIFSDPRGMWAVGIGLEPKELELLAERTTRLIRLGQLDAP